MLQKLHKVKHKYQCIIDNKNTKGLINKFKVKILNNKIVSTN